jgi:hypothetical protein
MQVSGQPYPQYPLDGGLGRPQTWTGHCGVEKDSLPLPGSEPCPLSPQPITVMTAIPAPPLDLAETIFPPAFISNTSGVAQGKRTLSRVPCYEKTAKNTVTCMSLIRRVLVWMIGFVSSWLYTYS